MIKEKKIIYYEILSDLKAKRILELESGDSNPEIKNFNYYISTDINKEFLKRIKRSERKECVLCDCKHLPFKEGSFDLIHVSFPSFAKFSLNGKEIYPTLHFEHLERSINEIRRVLDRGYFVIFPFYENGEKVSYQRIFWQQEISYYLKMNKFKNESKRVWENVRVEIFKSYS